MNKISTEDEVIKYWHVIRWNAASFLSGHDGRNSRLFRNDIARNLLQDAAYGFRSTITSTIKLLREPLLHLPHRRTRYIDMQEPYILLITLGSPKYADEERKILEACERNKLKILVIYPRIGFSESNATVNSFRDVLALKDYFCAMKRGLREIFSGVRFFISGDTKLRSLFVSAIASIQPYYLSHIMAKRIVDCYGKPQLALTLCPFSAVSVAMIDYLKSAGITTASIRTQTTSNSVEHFVINSEILFYKSRYEKCAYESVFANRGPQLEEGCILSLPPDFDEINLRLPKKYVLLLGTAMCSEQQLTDYFGFNKALFGIAKEFELPIIFKGHNLSMALDDAWFEMQGDNTSLYKRLYLIQQNRTLIDRATLVITAPSTLVYYAIMKKKPIIIQHTSLTDSRNTEFNSSPILQIEWSDKLDRRHMNIDQLNIIAKNAFIWLHDNYYLEKGPDYIVKFKKNLDK